MYQIKIESYKNDFCIEGIVDETVMEMLVQAFRDTLGVHFALEESEDEWSHYTMPKQLVGESLLSFKEID